MSGRSPWANTAERRAAYDRRVVDDRTSQERAGEEHGPAPSEPTEPTVPADRGPAAPEPEPDEACLVQVAEPARVRRAPKIGAFITAGVLVGALLGLIAALIAGQSSEVVADGTAFISIFDGQGGIRALMAFAGAVVGAFVGAGLAVRSDRRSARAARRDNHIRRSRRG